MSRKIMLEVEDECKFCEQIRESDFGLLCDAFNCSVARDGKPHEACRNAENAIATLEREIDSKATWIIELERIREKLSDENATLRAEVDELKRKNAELMSRLSRMCGDA